MENICPLTGEKCDKKCICQECEEFELYYE